MSAQSLTADPDLFILPSNKSEVSAANLLFVGSEINIQIQTQSIAVVLILAWDWVLLKKKIKDAKYFSEII